VYLWYVHRGWKKYKKTKQKIKTALFKDIFSYTQGL